MAENRSRRGKKGARASGLPVMPLPGYINKTIQNGQTADELLERVLRATGHSGRVTDAPWIPDDLRDEIQRHLRASRHELPRIQRTQSFTDAGVNPTHMDSRSAYQNNRLDCYGASSLEAQFG